MYYAIKTFLSEVTVALLDEEKRPFTFYTIRSEDINLGDVYYARITNKLPQLKAFFADIGNERTVFLSSKQPLEVGQKLMVIISKEERLGKIPEAKRGGLPMPHTPQTLGLKKKGDILCGISNPENYIQLEWNDAFDESYLEALEKEVPFAKGARLIFERTHAFHSIDVDSHTSTEPLDFLNEKAALLIGREIIKRNLSGNILIDFIGNKKKSEISNLKNIMSKELCKSPVAYQLMGVSPMGNVELRRNRSRASLADAASMNSALAYQLFSQIIKEPARIKNVKVALSLYAHLTGIMAETWKKVEAKTGEKVPLIASTNLSTYEIEYKS